MIAAVMRQCSRIIKNERSVGSIEVGKLAGIVAVEGDPLIDTKVFGKVIFVMKDGVVYKQQVSGF